jgi:hypothetical protein
MPKSRLVLLTFLLVCSPCAASEPAVPSTIKGEVTWSGEVTVREPVTVEPAASLVLAPGTQLTCEEKGTLLVRGRLTAMGEEGRPIRVQGLAESNTFCISVSGESAVLQLANVEVSGAKQAIEVRAGSVTCRSSRFVKNGSALAVDARGEAELTDLTFERNTTGFLLGTNSRVRAQRLTFRTNKVGLGLDSGAAGSFEDCSFRDNARAVADLRASEVILTRCTFTGNELALELSQSGQGPVISRSTFLGNKTGISAQHFSSPLVDACEFRDNEIAFSAEGFSNPFLRYCAFLDNGQATRFVKKSNGRLSGVRWERNKVALFADFASYPAVTGNLFTDNEWHVRLGNEQSVDFERKRGSVQLTRDAAKKKANPGVEATSPPAPLRPGVVSVENAVFSVAGNAWDEMTQKEMTSGPDANVSRFWDGRDQEPVRYAGFGDDRYAVDVITFLPFARRDQVKVGPEAWEPYAAPRK